MNTSGSITILMDSLRGGQDDAARLLWERYFPQLKHLVRLKLPHLPDPAVDEEDIAVGAFASFCRGIQSGRLDQPVNRDHIWNLLMTLAFRKVIDHRRASHTQKRGAGKPNKQLNLNGDLVLSGEDIELLVESQPTPEIAISLAEEFDALLGKLVQPDLREIALAKLEGYTDQEIALRRGCARRTIVRKLRVIRGVLLQDSPEMI